MKKDHSSVNYFLRRHATPNQFGVASCGRAYNTILMSLLCVCTQCLSLRPLLRAIHAQPRHVDEVRRRRRFFCRAG